MASKRKTVFGYRMEFGDIIPSPNEAETVQYIYTTYLTGASFQHLAAELDTANCKATGLLRCRR